MVQPPPKSSVWSERRRQVHPPGLLRPVRHPEKYGHHGLSAAALPSRRASPFDASAAAGFSTPEHTDLFLVPDGSTVSILPWRPVHERVMRMMCDIKNPDGTDFSDYTRNLLKTAIARAAACGYIVNVSTECEFYLFKTDAPASRR